MTTKRIIPCLDIRDGRVVKGVNFEGIQDVSDPVELARFYNDSGADELVFYDITASLEGRSLFMALLKAVANQVSLPLTVGGGIATLEDIDRVMEVGAHKVSINSAAIKNPNFIEAAAKHCGSPRVILSMDVKRVDDVYRVFARGGRENTDIDALEWAVMGQELGAGELVVNSIDTDGVKQGFDIEMLRAIADRVSIPITASGGAGKKEHFLEVFQYTGIEAGLAASIFHYKEVDIRELKLFLRDQGIDVYMGRQ
jgi:cyclase